MTGHVYNTNPETDGWKKVESEGPGKMVTVPQGMRKDITVAIPLQHYFKAGKSMCDKYPAEPEDTVFMNDPKNYCSDCLVGTRKLAKRTEELRLKDEAGDIAGAEADNVIDYKAAQKKDKPQTAKSSK